ncbi:helix-turn-helix domain-containing protein [Planktotalea arctica]|uniref:helix-turn-helix domain-containing protein n=1 Tax=Planktotalea arctica TaxID=1481893 RepID=UPI000A16E846|nr:AraC family transcriptional regulator [Planktotalea arctica]
MNTLTPQSLDQKTVTTIAQRAGGAPWRLGLAHARPEHTLIWVTRGAARAVVEGRGFAMSSHNALFIPAGTLFSFTWETSCFGQTVLLAPRPGLDWPPDPLLLRVREPKAQLTLTHYVEAIQTEAASDLPMAAVAASAHAQLMTVWAHRFAAPSQNEKISAARRLMRAFCALIVQSENFTSCGASMAEYAAKLGVTPTHLTRVSRAECGMTAADLLTQHSLQRACRMIEDDALKAVDVARNLGFSTPAYFTRFIKAHTGLTPSQLRKAAHARRSPAHP